MTLPSGEPMNYDDISVDLAASAVRLKGPAAFLSAIDWETVELVAAMLCPALAPEEAVHEAVWRQYATWWEEEHRRGCIDAEGKN